MVKAFALHLPNNVKSAVWPCAYGKVTAVPVSVADHPPNV